MTTDRESLIDRFSDQEVHEAHEHAVLMVSLTWVELRRRGYRAPGVPFTNRDQEDDPQP